MGYSGFFDGNRRTMAFDAEPMRKLDLFLDTRIAPFSAKNALSSLDKRATAENIALMEEYLASSPLVFRYNTAKRGEKWLTRAGLFEGKSFAVMLTKQEIASGVFIPASRCAPFANPRLLPSSFRFYAGGKPLPRVVVDWDETEAVPFYSLFGIEFAPQLMEMDNGESIDDSDIGKSDGTFPLKAIDMREFYWKRQARPGDYLIFTVKNWTKAHFSVSLRSKNEDAKGVEQWRRLFSRFLDESFSVAGPCASIEEQLAWVFFTGRAELFSFPPDDILNAISLSENVGFFPYGVETRLWKAGADFSVPRSWEDWLLAVIGDAGAVVFDETAFPATAEVLECYIMDSLRRGEENPDVLLERLHELNGGKGSETGDLALTALVLQEFKLIRASYNVFEDGNGGLLRARIVDSYSRVVSLVRWCQSVGTRPENVQVQDVLMLCQLAQQLVMCMEYCCLSYYGGGGISIPADSIEGMEDALSDLEISIKNAAENHRRKARGKQPHCLELK